MQTDESTNITKLSVAFRNFAKVPKKHHLSTVVCSDGALLLIFLGF